ncbi:MAG: aminotransferase class V-fold PLP-dependent enzyme, partial [Planctomycetota bacterium]|nr:aminotransferase class V-fold PLP-dependent enzyme [Planctomycetota bacterium]
HGASSGNAFMVNATSAINAVVRSMSFNPGDTIATTSHVYNAVRKTLQWVARRDGANYVEFDVPLPVHSSDDLLDRMIQSIPDTTRLLLVDHVSSPTGLVFPIEPLLDELVPRGISVLIDGAHAPGMLDVNVRRYLDLGAIAWTGNLHKWCFAPKGCAVLEVHPSVADRIQPTIISHHAEEPFYKRFQWQGTADFTPWLSVPEALAFPDEQFGWDTLRRVNHDLVVWSQQMLTQAWQVEPVSPLDGSMLGSLATIELPEHARRAFGDAAQLQAHLSEAHRIEVPVMDWGGRWYVRVSAQAYNTPDDYRALAHAVLSIG